MTDDEKAREILKLVSRPCVHPSAEAIIAAALREKGRAERERCAKECEACDGIPRAAVIAARIRALGDDE